jgi:transcriptional regulator with XRE-family HTH domain
MNQPKTAGELIYEARKYRSLSIRDLAKLSGVSHAVISQYETEKYGISMGCINAYKICKALSLNIEEFVGAIYDSAIRNTEKA